MAARTLPREGDRIEVRHPVEVPWMIARGTVTWAGAAIASVTLDDGSELTLVRGDCWGKVW